MPQSVKNFMLQQGFPEEPQDACNMRFEGLYFQPRIVFGLVLVGVVLQQPPIFLGIAAVLFWNVLFPALNPFESAYNRWIARPRGRQPLTPAPAPRRFAQAVNAAFNLASGLLLVLGLPTASWVVQALRGCVLAAALREVLPGRLRVPPAARRGGLRQLHPAVGWRHASLTA